MQSADGLCATFFVADGTMHTPDPEVRPMFRARILCTLAGLLFCGCAAPPRLMPAPLVRMTGQDIVLDYDTDHDGRPDLRQWRAPGGRKYALAHLTPAGEVTDRILPDELDPADCPHLLIALDGVPFELVDELYRAGHFRWFHPPARVIACHPAMTDLALADLFHCGPCRAYQARWFNRRANRVDSGNDAYLNATNSPWVAHVDYRCSFWWDVLVYLDPQTVFNHELHGILRTFRRTAAGTASAYSVGTAGLGTRGGRDAIRAYLRTIDRLCEQLICERHGRVKITLTADHGHNLVPNRRVSFNDLLRQCGYRPAKSLRGPRDVVTIEYGLVTYAELYTQDPVGVAACLLSHADVEFACYPADDAVVVVSSSGRATIRARDGAWSYTAETGDPLRLAGIIADLGAAGHITPDGWIEDRALFEATVAHVYPDPLRRIWRAFCGLVENPPDLIVNLRDGACHGSKFFHTMIGEATSTHGSLNRLSSTTFAMTTLRPLPSALRTEDVESALANP